MYDVHMLCPAIMKMQLHSQWKLAPALALDLERWLRDLDQVMWPIAGVQEETHMSHELADSIGFFRCCPHIGQPLVCRLISTPIVSPVERNVLGDVANDNPDSVLASRSSVDSCSGHIFPSSCLFPRKLCRVLSVKPGSSSSSIIGVPSDESE